MSECLLYYIKDGETRLALTHTHTHTHTHSHTSDKCLLLLIFRVGKSGDIQLSGQFIMEDHCTFKREGGDE